MKKQLLPLALPLALCLTLFAGCGDAALSSSENGASSAAENTSSQVTMVSSEQTPVSSEQAPVSSTASTESVSQSNEPYLTANPDKSDAYNEALAAYNDFLCGKITARVNEDGALHITNQLTMNNEVGIGDFGLYDINGDEIPELHTRGMIYRVFSYANNEVVQWDAISGSKTQVLENGALLLSRVSDSIFNNYITFDSNGTVSTVFFSEPRAEGVSYRFEDKDVSKTEYEKLTKEYYALMAHVADLDWQNWNGVRK